jgi:hypothetical protein
MLKSFKSRLSLLIVVMICALLLFAQYTVGLLVALPIMGTVIITMGVLMLILIWILNGE